MAADAAAICKRLDQLRSLRTQHELTWRECFDFSFPIRGSGFNGDILLGGNEAADRRAALLDSTSTDSGRTLAAALVGGTMPASARSFELDVDGSDEEGKGWLEEGGDTLHKEMHASNFDSAGYESMLDMVPAGWFALYVDVDRINGGFAFEQWPIAQCYIATTKPGGPIDTVYRSWSMTAQQAVEEFGHKLSPASRDTATTKPDEPIEFVRAIYPRSLYAVEARLARNLPVASCTVETKTRHIVRESGYHEMPVIVPRWMVIPASVYAVGPMYDALPDVKELNELKRMEKQAAALTILPPFKAMDDGVLNVGAIKRLQSGKIYAVNDIDNFQPILTGGKFELALSSEERLQASIRRTLMADQLTPQEGPQMTATEVHARIALIRQLLGPIYGRLQSEYLSPLIVRCFGLAYRAGILGQAPQSIAGREFAVRYISPLARAQRLEDVTAMDRFELALGQEAAVKPEVLDVYDWDEGARRRGEFLGVPRDLLLPRDRVEQIRQARVEAAQQQQQQAQQQEMQGAMADAAAKRFAAA